MALEVFSISLLSDRPTSEALSAPKFRIQAAPTLVGLSDIRDLLQEICYQFVSGTPESVYFSGPRDSLCTRGVYIQTSQLWASLW